MKTGVPVLANLLHKDLLSAYRDRFLVFLSLYPVVITLSTRYVIAVARVPHLDVYLAPANILMAQYVVGIIVGFNLIEEREMQTWIALRVMPGGTRFSRVYYTGFTVLASVFTALFSAVVYGVVPRNVPLAVAGTLAASLTGTMVAFALGSLAQNKIEGLALTKTAGFGLISPALLFVAPPAWQVLVAWSPWYWTYISLLWAYGGNGVSSLPLLKWPGYSPVVSILATLTINTLGVALFWRKYTSRAS